MPSRRALRSRAIFSCDARARPRSFPGQRRLDRAEGSHQYHCRQNAVRIARVPVHSTTPQSVALQTPTFACRDTISGSLLGGTLYARSHRAVIIDAIEAYEAKRWPLGKIPGGKARPMSGVLGSRFCCVGAELTSYSWRAGICHLKVTLASSTGWRQSPL